MNIEFVIPCYERTGHLFALLGSLIAQNNPNWKAHVIADHPPQEALDRITGVINFLNDERIVFTNLPVRYNDWGHTPRNYGLQHSTEELIVMTGEDNYYMPTFVNEFHHAILKNNTNFVYCNMVHNLTDNSYLPVKTKIELGYIDIGCCMYRKKYIKDLLLDVTYPESDFTFMQKYLIGMTDSFMPITKIDKILYVHN